MRIEEVETENFCQHAKRKDKFGPGVTLILGPNGSGKTNLVNAIQWGLTGSCTLPGKKEDNLNWDGAEKGFVRVSFSNGGNTGVIKRSINSASCTMEFAGKKYKSATEIDNVIYQILGVPPRVLSDMVFVRQGFIEGVLFQRPADRAKSLQVLFGTDNAEPLRDLLQTEIVGTVINSRAEIIQQLSTQLKWEVEKPLEEAETLYAGLQPQLLNGVRVASSKDMVARFDAARVAGAGLDAVLAEEQVYKGQLAAAMGNQQRLRGAVNDIRLVLDESKLIVEESSRKITQQTHAAVQQQQREHALASVEALKKALSEPEPVRPVIPVELPVWKDKLAEMGSEIATSRKVVTALRGGAGVCPTCLQTINAKHLEEHERKLQELEPAVASLRKTIVDNEAVARAYEAEFTRWSGAQTWNKHRLATDERQLAVLPQTVLLSPEAVKEAQEIIAGYNDANASYQQLARDLAVADESVRRLEANVVAVGDRINKLIAAKQCGVTDVDYANAKSALERHEKAAVSVAELRGRIEILFSQKKQLGAQLAAYENEERKLGILKDWKATLERARMILHRDQLPNLVAQAYLQAINQRLAKYLDVFDVKYTAAIKPDISIECRFGGRRVMPAERLSGGQKVMLGAAFRFAVYDLFTANLGLLILDEPTVYLDDDRIDSVISLLENVKSYSKNAGLQLIVITHEKSLEGVCDQAIRL
jgi:DNA repair exonuclease SbcCD ATPase subunit